MPPKNSNNQASEQQIGGCSKHGSNDSTMPARIMKEHSCLNGYRNAVGHNYKLFGILDPAHDNWYLSSFSRGPEQDPRSIESAGTKQSTLRPPRM